MIAAQIEGEDFHTVLKSSSNHYPGLYKWLSEPAANMPGTSVKTPDSTSKEKSKIKVPNENNNSSAFRIPKDAQRLLEIADLKEWRIKYGKQRRKEKTNTKRNAAAVQLSQDHHHVQSTPSRVYQQLPKQTADKALSPKITDIIPQSPHLRKGKFEIMHQPKNPRALHTNIPSHRENQG